MENKRGVAIYTRDLIRHRLSHKMVNLNLSITSHEQHTSTVVLRNPHNFAEDVTCPFIKIAEIMSTLFDETR